MKTLCKDVLLAALLGLVLPGVILNSVVFGLDRLKSTLPEAAALEETVVETTYQAVPVPVLLRLPGGALEERDMDAYLVGVVLAEMPASFEMEALKAQAVAARTYAWKAYTTGGKHEDGSICTDSGCCQAYISEEDYLNKNGNWENLRRVRTAVYATSGQVVTYQGALIEAAYFSCSGGSTEDARAVWSTDLPYLQAVDSPGEEAAAWYQDKTCFSFQEFQDKLEVTLEGEPAQWFGETTYTDGGGVATMEIGGEIYAGTLLRSKLGLRSTAFTLAVGEKITITTRGYGHRVGMSQYGADAMAVRGSTYREILAHYYTGTEVTEIS